MSAEIKLVPFLICSVRHGGHAGCGGAARRTGAGPDQAPERADFVGGGGKVSEAGQHQDDRRDWHQ